MKYLTTVFLTFLFSSLSQAQVGFEKGQFDISAGIGFPNTTHTAIDGGSSLFNLEDDDDRSSTPFYNINATYAIVNNVGLGVYAGYFQSDSELLSTAAFVSQLANLAGANISLNDVIGNTEYTVFSLGGKLELHKPILRDVEKLDTYASTYVGYNFVNDEINIQVSNNPLVNTIANSLITSSATFPDFTYEVNAGAKYDIAENWAIFGEAGFGRFLINAGLTYRIGNAPASSN